MSATSIAEKFEVIADRVYEAGQKSEYDRFWDNIQQNGNRTHYESAFRNWECEEINPKYPLTTSTANGVFSSNKLLKSCPPIIPTTDTIIYYSCFNACNSLVEINFDIRPSNLSTALTATFNGCFSLTTIKNIVSTDDVKYQSTTFSNCNSLKNISFEGVIGTSINFQWSPLSRASFENIIEHLSPTVTGQSVTFKKSAVDAAFETSEGANDGSTSTEWIDLITPYSNQYNGNWTISLV